MTPYTIIGVAVFALCWARRRPPRATTIDVFADELGTLGRATAAAVTFNQPHVNPAEEHTP